MSLITQEVLICHFCTKPITTINGHDSDSLLMHHITYIPEVKAPAHCGCHARYHATHPNHPTDPAVEYRKRFKRLIKNGEDIFCYFCGEQVIKMNGADFDSLLIHSLDGNNSNWGPSNKVPTHRGCHTKYHATNIWADPDYRTRLSPAIREGQRRRFKNPGDREICITQAKNAWITRRRRYGEDGFSDRPRKKRFKTDRDRARLGERVRWGYAWRKFGQVFGMLFDDIVDEDAETFTCSHCNRVFSKIGWLRRHISIQHKSREADELESLNICMVKKIENGEKPNE